MDICKYCLEDSKENEQPLIYPCRCTDGVHANCLAVWLLFRPVRDDSCRCEICNVNYIGVFIQPSPPNTPPPRPPPPPPPPAAPPPPPPQPPPPPFTPRPPFTTRPPPPLSSSDDEEEYIVMVSQSHRNDNISIDYICCECQLFEAALYITGTIFGLNISILSITRSEYDSAETHVIFNVFVGLFILLYSMGLICTGRRYYKRCINGRRVYANDD